MTKFRILSLDGGGIRGAFGAALLDDFEQRLGTSITDYFDLIAGTSTGAIIGAALASGLSAGGIVDFYSKHGSKIFHPRPPHRPNGWLRPVFPLAKAIFRNRTGGNFDDFFRARYCPFELRDAFTIVFGEKRLRDLKKSRFIVPAVNLSEGSTHVFRTPHLPDRPECTDERVTDVLRAATAAPTYFEHQELGNGHAYCDGGVWANNPSILAVAEAMKIRQYCKRAQCDPDYDTSAIQVLSIGTGNHSYCLKPPGADAGILYWSTHIADVMGISQVQGVQSPLEFFLGERYHAINFDLPDKSWSLDAVDRIDDLFELGRKHAAVEFDGLRGQFFDEPAPDYVPFGTEADSQAVV